MTALAVTGLILLFLLFLLVSPVRLYFTYKHGDVTASLHYLAVTIDFSPEAVAKRAEKKAERAVKKEYKKQKQEEGAKAKKSEAASDTAKTVWSLLKSCKKGVDTIRNHLIFYRIRAVIIAGGEDAHKTGVNYGNICAIVSNGLSLLDLLFAVREPEISIRPDFTLERTSMDISFRVKIAPWYVFSAAFSILFQFIKVILANKQKRKIVKGGKRHEPTAPSQ